MLENTDKCIYFIGIGGISMSGLAEILKFQGFKVLGSDIKESEVTKNLRKKHIDVFIGQKKENLENLKIDFLVYTSAISDNNEELIFAKENNMKILERAELLAEIMKNYGNSIAVSGTHGKTTTTSLLAHILLYANTDPTISIGGMLDLIGGNIRLGSSEFFLAEACEYKNNFLRLAPFLGLILNIELDHLDFFKDRDDIRKSFKLFAKNIFEDGCLVINSDIDDYEEIANETKAKVLSFGRKDGDCVKLLEVEYHLDVSSKFTVLIDNKKEEFKLNAIGEHNIFNALAAITTAYFLNIDLEDIKAGLSSFKGIHRRFEYKGEYNGAKIYDDYAHHPTEIVACLKAAKSLGNEKIYLVFQPHTYTRTKTLLDDFVKSFDLADELILLDIFAAREVDTQEIHSKDLLKKLDNEKSKYFSDIKDVENYLRGKLQNKDLLITMGAGDVYLLGESLIS